MLEPITRDVKLRDFLVYDLEWYPKTLEVRLCGVYDGKADQRGQSRYRSYLTVDDFLEGELTPQNDKRYFYAHAGGLADMQFLLERIFDSPVQYQVKAAFSGSAAIIVQIKRGKLTWTFVDSYWLLRDSLRNIGKAVGLHKGGSDYYCGGFPSCGHIDSRRTCRCPYFHPGKDATGSNEDECEDCGKSRLASQCIFYAPLQILADYNERDNEILYKAIEQFQELILQLGGELASTIASCGMTLFRRKYLQRSIKTDPWVNEVARESYVGSRVEPFGTTYQPDPIFPSAWYLDLNSSFPHAMRSPQPGNFLGHAKAIPNGEDETWLARATVHVPESMYLPPLPYRKGARIYFPTGAWTAWFSGVDLHLLEEAGGRIEKVDDVLLFEPFDDLSGYAEDLYARRKASRKGSFENFTWKLLLNACYGKFAENREKEALYFRPSSTRCPHSPAHDTECLRCRGKGHIEKRGVSMVCSYCQGEGVTHDACISVLFPGAILRTDITFIEHEHVPIAENITALARRNLYRYMAQSFGGQWDDCPIDEYGHRVPHRLFYCDTDSIITTRLLPSSDELGALKLEYEIVDGEFLAPKVYRVGAVKKGERKEVIRAKGFSEMTVEKFAALRAGQEIEIERMVRIRELLRGGRTADGRAPSPRQETYRKALRHTQQSKRCFLSGGDSRPWKVTEIR